MKNRKIAGIFLAIFIIIALVAGVVSYAKSSQMTIDSSWIIIANHDDEFDAYNSQQISDAYGSLQWDISIPRPYDERGVNLIIIGGSEYLSEQAPWLRALAISEPEGRAKIGFKCVNETAWTWELVTPRYTYKLDTGANDYGFISVSYDYIRMRHVIAIVGYTHFSTRRGVDILLDMPLSSQKLLSNSYLVYNLLQHPTEYYSDTDWNHKIVEQG